MIDEANKMLAPKYSSHSENVNQSVASEGLKLMEGTIVDVKSGSASYAVDTSQISLFYVEHFPTRQMKLPRTATSATPAGAGLCIVYRISMGLNSA